MTNEEVLNALSNVKKGRYVNLTKQKVLKKGVVKISDLVIRLGVSYANMAINEGKETGELPWGHWVQGLENLVIEHTNKKGETNYYLRVASSYSQNGKCSYYYDGKEITKEQAKEIENDPKEFESKELDVYNIKFENLISIGVQLA